jgi:hypothetical protein
LVAKEAAVSEGWLSMFEHGDIPNPGLLSVSKALAVVGLDVSCRVYPSNGDAIRDAGQTRLLARFARFLYPSLIWRLEVPLPLAGDKRAWDATVQAADRGWRYGIEAETRPTDGQDLTRRLRLKHRDGGMDGVLLVLPDTRATRIFLRAYEPLLAQDFPIEGRLALARLTRGEDPGGSAIVVC